MLKTTLMPRPSTVTLAIFGAAFVTWLAAASSSGPRTASPPASAAQERTVPAQALIDDVARLHDRLDHTPALIRPARNPFRFTTSRAGPPASRPRPTPHDATAADDQSAAPGLSLVGMAEDPGSDGISPQRTAIIASTAGVLFVKIGDELGGQYRVVRIDADAIELTRLADASVVRLALK